MNHSRCENFPYGYFPGGHEEPPAPPTRTGIVALPPGSRMTVSQSRAAISLSQSSASIMPAASSRTCSRRARCCGQPVAVGLPHVTAVPSMPRSNKDPQSKRLKIASAAESAQGVPAHCSYARPKVNGGSRAALRNLSNDDLSRLHVFRSMIVSISETFDFSSPSILITTAGLHWQPHRLGGAASRSQGVSRDRPLRSYFETFTKSIDAPIKAA